jgi:hypothetical protein
VVVMQNGSPGGPTSNRSGVVRSASVSGPKITDSLYYGIMKDATSMQRTVSAGSLGTEASGKLSQSASNIHKPSSRATNRPQWVFPVASASYAPVFAWESSSKPASRAQSRQMFGRKGYAAPTGPGRLCVARKDGCTKTATRRCLTCEEYHCHDNALYCDECYGVDHVRTLPAALGTLAIACWLSRTIVMFAAAVRAHPPQLGKA